MKSSLAITIILTSLVTLGLGARVDDSSLMPGQCYSLPDSKNYLESLKARPSSFTTIISEIGQERFQKIQDSSFEKYYFCKIRCKNQSGTVDSFWLTQSDSPGHLSDMNGFLCAGVSIENVQIVGSIYGPQPVIATYWAFETDFPEAHAWLAKTNFSLTPADYQKKFLLMRATFNQIAAAYTISSSADLKSAGLTLSKLVDGSSEGNALLRTYLNTMHDHNWNFRINYSSVDSIVLSNIKIYGRFLEYRKSDSDATKP